MEKITQLLEQYVQWIVLALCVAFLGFMGYRYWVAPVSAVSMNGKPVRPDEINDAILNAPVMQIKNDLKKEPPTITVKDHEAMFIADEDFATPAYASIYKPLPAWPLGHASETSELPGPAGSDPNEHIKIATAPKPPAPTDLRFSTGRMFASIPDPVAKDKARDPAAVAAAAAVPADKGKNKNANNPDPPDVKTRDFDWATIEGSIPASDLEEAFTSAFKAGTDVELPPDLFSTRILKVELHRQEKMLDGSWSKQDTIVAPLEMYKMRPLPASDATQQVSYEFIDWALNHPDYIAMPAFYDAEKGKPWHAPGDDSAAAGAAGSSVAPPVNNVPFDPAHPPKNRRLTPDERKAVADYRKAQKALKSPPAAGPAAGGLPPGMMPGAQRPGAYGKAKPYYEPVSPKSKTAAPRQPSGYPMMPPGMMPPGMLPPGYGRGPYPGMTPPGFGRSPYPGMPGMGVQPGMVNPRIPAAAGSGAIDVQSLSDDLKIWAHDETVHAGKTYRYSMCYFLLNPLFASGPDIECPEKLKQTLWLQSPMSEWSEPVHISERVNFWLTQMTLTAARFEVFEWKNDAWTNHVRSVGPGDQIPGTNWTVADIRKDVKGQYVLVVNDAGIVERRDLKADSESSEYQEMKDEAAGGAKAAQ